MAINNSTDLFGPSPFIVNSTPGLGSYTTIQAAVTAAAATGGTVYIQEGTYTENITFPANVAVVGAGTGDLFNVIIIGNHTFSSNGMLSFQYVKLQPSSSASPVFLINPSSGASAVDFSNSDIDSTSSSVLCFSVLSTGSATASLHLFNTSVTSSINAITVGNQSTVSVDVCNISGQTTAVNLTSSSSVFNSTYTSYIATDSIFLFSANGRVGSICDIFNSSASTYFARATGAFGTLGYSYSTVLNAKLVDPQITQDIYDTTPNQTPGTNGQLLIGSTGAAPVLSTLTAGIGIAITNGAGSITVGTSGGTALSWSLITANRTLTTNSGFIVTSGSLTLALPTVSNVGDVIVVLLDTGTSWTISQAAGQVIRLGSLQTTVGTSGSLTSTALGDSVELVCTQANTRWNTYATQGNITVI
jgi:hypothetical protein